MINNGEDPNSLALSLDLNLGIPINLIIVLSRLYSFMHDDD